MKKEQQELSEPTIERYFDARDENGDLYLASSNYEMGSKDERGADWVLASDYDALLALHKASLERERELQAQLAVGDGSCDHCGAVPSIIMPTSLCDECADGVKRAEAAESQLLAKDALIASLKAEISKQNKDEEELLATGEKLAEEKA